MSYNPLGIARAVAAAESAGRAIEEWYESRPVDGAVGVHARWEEDAAELVGRERAAREELIQLLVRLEPVTSITVMLGNGTLVNYTDNGDGLSIVQADRLIGLDLPEHLRCQPDSTKSTKRGGGSRPVGDARLAGRSTRILSGPSPSAT
jgi:hypothetical protein